LGKRLEEIAGELSLYVRTIAYLTAIPRAKLQNGTEERLPARINEYKGAEPPLPPLSHRRLYDLLMEVGPVENGGMGPTALSWQEIEAWRRNTAAWISPREAILLRRLSSEYLAESHAAEDQYRAPPWIPVGSQVDQDLMLRRLMSVLG
jgi:hypothetical protein